MLKLLPAFLALFLFALATQAQQPSGNGQIKGYVLDSVTAEPVVYATIAVREAGKTEVIKASYTNASGFFDFKNLPEKPLEVLVAFVGYNSKTIAVTTFPAGNAPVDMGRIRLAPAAVQLEAVEVTGEKLLIKQDIDKITYEVEADPESKTLTALDMLRKVPMITVDGQDKIELKGSSNYRVLVNGKSSSLFAREPSDVFKSMPASTIKRIEVITDPSAKYDAEGVGGIINVITVKQTLGGYNGSLTAGGGLPENYRGSGFGTVKTGKFGAAVYFGYNTYQQPRSDNFFVRKDFRNQGSELRQVGGNVNRGKWGYFDAQLSFQFDSLNLLTAEIDRSLNRHSSRQMQHVELLTGQGELVQAYERHNRSTDNGGGGGVSLDYQRSFANKPEQLLTLSYKRDEDISEDATDILLEPLLNAPRVDARSHNDAGTTEHTGQIDYVQPLGKQTFESGVKTIIRLSRSDYFYATVNPATGVEEVVPAMSNKLNYRQDIYAAYSSASLRKDKWGLKLGARVEETRIHADFTSSDTTARQQYLNLIPSVALSRKMGKMANVKLSYNQRIERPGLWFINPFVDINDPRNISYGNPNLRPVISHNIDFGYSTFIKSTSVGGSVSRNAINNSIQEFTVLGADSVSRRTYGNIGISRITGLSVFASTTLFKKLSLRLNASGRYNQISSSDPGFKRSNQGFTGNFSSGLTYSVGKTWKLSVNGGGSTRRITLQGTTAGFGWNSLTLSKSLLPEEKLSLVFSSYNPFNRIRMWGREINDPDFYQLNENHFINWSFTLSLSYKFGKLDDQIAQKKRGISNDDVSTGGGSGGGAK